MNLKSLHLSAVCLLFMSSVAFAQRSSVNADPLTGAGNVVIPIYTVSSGQVAVPVSLVYNGTGVRTKDVEGTAGMNWNVEGAGGQISRLVRGLPDDVTKDNLGNQRLGWMSPLDTAAKKISTFTIQNDGATCSKETTDISFINTNFPFKDDTEPDLFYVSAPGLSCTLVYDRADTPSVFRPVTYQDLVITYTLVGGSGNNASNIASFTITNDKGIKYTFAQPEGVTQTTILGTGGTATYFATKYKQYQNGITYDDSWDLTSITDPNGNGVTFSYTAAPVRNSTDPVVLFIGGSTTQAVQYFVQQAAGPQTLSTIGTTNANASATYLTFAWTTWDHTGQTGQTVVSGITGMGRNFQFSYNPVVYTGSGYTRHFLSSFSDPGCSTPINYQFGYIGQTYNNSLGEYTTTLADSASTQVDYWGYYSSNASGSTLIPSVYVLNPVISYYPRYVIDASGSPGADYIYALLASNNRAVTTTTVTAGALNKVSYVQGGNTTISYESNDYFDPIAGSVMEGGGIRVKQIIDSVSTGSTNNIVRNYTYVNPAGVTNAGLSSGEPLTLPQFAFTIPYSGSATGLTLWTDATALSAYDLSNDDHTIMYAYSKVSQTGAGSTIYNFSVPETYWSLSNPTLNYVGRYTCTATYGPIKNYDYSYPFIPNPNYEFDRGQPLSTINYNDAGTKVSETDYTYTTSYSPSIITAFKADDGGPSGLIFKGYNKYIVNYGSSALAATVINKVFDSPTLSVAQSDTTTYTYGSSYHKLVSQVQKTNSDRSIVSTYIHYIKDFPAATSGSNMNATAVYNLRNMNINIPVETYQQVTRSGTTKTTGGSLTFFKGVTPGSATLYLPSQQRKLVQPDGLSSFNPLTISGQTVTYDSLDYFPVANYQQYENTGFPLTVDDNNKHIQTTFFDHLTNHPTASFSNAKYNEAAFNDFDTQTAPPYSTFWEPGSGFTPVGSHAGKAYGLISTQAMTSTTLAKNAIAQNYIFSIWINAAASGTLTLTLTGFSTNPTVAYTTGGWKYYELKIPVGTLASSYTVSFTANTNISIDDILFYPDVAEATTATYDATTHYKIAQTNTNGVSAYFTNDEWGRTLYAYDQDHNIVQKNTFITPADIASYIPIISYHTTATAGIPTAFNISGTNACTAAGGTVTWHFGDGTSASAALGVSVNHTYTTAKIDTVTATVASPIFGTKSLGPVYVTVSPGSIPLSYVTYTYSNGDISSVVFSQSGVTKYSFTGAQLNTAHVLQGNYTIQVVLSDGLQFNPITLAGYNSIDLSGNCGDWCKNWTRGNSYTFSADITNCTSLAFTVTEYLCGS